MNKVIRAALNEASQTLQSAGIDSAALDARLLMQAVLAYDHAALIAHDRDSLSDTQSVAFKSYISRRSEREPVSHIVGHRDFWKDRFHVSSDVLDPRPDSETLIEAAIEARPDRTDTYHILDLGVGSGCLLLSLLREYPNAHGTGVDISDAALSIAAGNALTLGMSQRVIFYQDNWGKALQNQYDMIMSNPPYIPGDDISGLAPEVRDFEPMGALSGGADGLDAYQALMPEIKRLLKADGVAVVELGAGQRGAVSDIARKTGLQVQSVQSDLAGIERVLVINHS